VRQAHTKNKQQTKALPCLGVASEAEGSNIIVLVGSSGYGEMKDRYVLSGFYNEEASKKFGEGGMVDRIYEAGKWLATVRAWTRTEHPHDPFPQNPFTNLFQ